MSIVLKSKSNKPSPGFAGIAGFNLDDLANHASDQLAKAQQAAEAIVEQAQQQAEAIKEQARQEGYQAGLIEAEKVIDQRVKVAVDSAVHSRLATLEAAIDQLWENEFDWLQQWRTQTLHSAFQVARRITRQAVLKDDEIVLRWANEALDNIRGARRVTLAVHPETLSILGQQLDHVVRRPGLPQETHIEPDETVEPMGIVVRQDGGQIDMQWTTQFDELEKQLGLNSESEVT